METSGDKSLKNRTQDKIRFLEEQLVSLDHYLPETWDFLMHELDLQKRLLAELKVQEHFQTIDNHDKYDRNPS